MYLRMAEFFFRFTTNILDECGNVYYNNYSTTYHT